MDTVQSFRTAVGGFNKNDVADYITKTAREHRAALEEKDRQIQSLEKRIDDLEMQLTEAQLSPSCPQDGISEANPISEDPALPLLELAAYRRAEAAERLANQRAKKLYQEIDSICADVSNRFDSASSETQRSLDAIRQQMSVIDKIYGQLTAALQNANQSLSALGATIPDPAETMEE